MLWTAKFPSKNDTVDVGAWEIVANNMARSSNIRVVEASAKKYNSKYHTYLTKRFDGTAAGERIHFSSAMTMLGYNDGNGVDEGVSYLELVEFIIQNGANVNADLEELFRRIVFSIAMSNTDDHLRNHGFILTTKGWIPSSAYDINPNPYRVGLKFNISENDNSLDYNLALNFRLSEGKANGIIDNVKLVVSNWEKVATNYKLSRIEQDIMRPAFRF